MLLKQTKIVATISDQRCDVDFIKQLFDAGLNVVRMNTAHAGREGFEKLIANVRTVSNRIAILMDTKGPEGRTTANEEPIPYKIGEKVKIVGNPELETTRECIAVSYPNFVHDLNIGGTILIDDGDLELEVIDKTADYLLCEVKNEATLGSRKSVNVPGVRINLPSLTEKDRNNILYAIEKDIDFIAHSFVRNRQDVFVFFPSAPARILRTSRPAPVFSPTRTWYPARPAHPSRWSGSPRTGRRGGAGIRHTGP